MVFLPALCVSAPAVELYSVTKGMRFEQVDSGPPQFLPIDEYLFEAKLLTATNAVRSAFFEGPDFLDHPLTKSGNSEFEFDDLENDPVDLSAKYPDGAYTFYITTRTNGNQVRGVQLTPPGSGSAYPPRPHISNYNELQGVPGPGYIRVTWDPWTGGTSRDFIQLRIETNNVRAFETRDFGEPGALDGRTTSVLIEAGRLPTDEVCFATLEFRKTSGLKTNSYGSIGWSYYHRRTEFEFQTSTFVPDVESYAVNKGRVYTQTNTAFPVIEATNGYVFSATLESTVTNAILENTLYRPDGRSGGLGPEECRPALQLETNFASSVQGGLDSEYPDGTYRFDVTTVNNGSLSGSLTLESSDYPPIPYINNFDPSAPVRTNEPIAINWDPWIGGTASDFIQLRLALGCSNIFETPDYGDQDALNGFATGAVIPAGILQAGESYNARLTFRRFVDIDTTSIPGALGVASYYSRTRFEIEPIQDLQDFEIAKGRHYIQTNTAAPILDGTNAYQFSAELDAQTPSSVISSVLRLPNGVATNMIADGLGQFIHAANSADPLDEIYPEGTYNIEVETLHDGLRVLPLTLTGPAYPPAPHIQHDPLSRVSPDQTNTISWDAWVGGEASDFIQVRIRDQGITWWETPDFGDEGALTGLATSATIPPGVLTKSRNYSARVIFQRVVDTNTVSYPGADGLAYYYSRTEIDFRTVRGDIESYSVEKGRSFVQVDTNLPVAEALSEYMFGAELEASTTNVITTNSLFVPNREGYIVLVDPVPPPDEFQHSQDFPTLEDGSTRSVFDSAYPNGVYRFEAVTTNDGPQSLELNLTGDDYPPVPYIRNFESTSFSNFLAGTAIDLQWDPWLGGTTNDFVQVQVRDQGANVFETPNYGDVGALDGLATTATIPGDALLPGKSYSTRVIFRRFVQIAETNDLGAEGLSSYFTRTKFTIFTADPDVRSYNLVKGRQYVQTNSGAPVAIEYVFRASVVGGDLGEAYTINSFRVTTPLGEEIDEAFNERATWTLHQVFPTQEDLDARYPDGTYTFTIDGLFYGVTNLTLYLTNALYPNPPHIINYDEAAHIIPPIDFVLSWDPFIGGTSQDFVEVTFIDPVTGEIDFLSPPRGDPLALTGLDNAMLIPADTLVGNSVFMVSNLFEKVLLADKTTYVESEGRVGYYSLTTWKALTIGPGNPPGLPIQFFEMPFGQVRFRVNTIPGLEYVIEGSSDLVNWDQLFSTVASEESFIYEAPQPGPMFFYRVKLIR